MRPTARFMPAAKCRGRLALAAATFCCLVGLVGITPALAWTGPASHQRIGARIAGRDEPVVGLDGSTGLGSGQRADELWSVLRVQFLLGHLFVSSANSVVRLGADATRPRTPCERDRPVLLAREDEKEQAGIFGGPELIAAEEARSREGGQHMQMPPRADDARARLRPAPGGRCKQSMCGELLHGIPDGPSIDHCRIHCTAAPRFEALALN